VVDRWRSGGRTRRDKLLTGTPAIPELGRDVLNMAGASGGMNPVIRVVGLSSTPAGVTSAGN